MKSKEKKTETGRSMIFKRTYLFFLLKEVLSFLWYMGDRNQHAENNSFIWLSQNLSFGYARVAGNWRNSLLLRERLKISL